MSHIGFGKNSFALKAIGFTNKANPDAVILTLFSDGKQGAWYDPSDKSTLFQDVAGTVPVTKDGDPVALMKDKSGNGNHAIAPSSAARPIYRTDGVLHWLSLDGVDDNIGAINNIPLVTNSIVAASYKSTPTSSVISIIVGLSTGTLVNRLEINARQARSRYFIREGGNFKNTTEAAALNNIPHVATAATLADNSLRLLFNKEVIVNSTTNQIFSGSAVAKFVIDSKNSTAFAFYGTVMVNGFSDENTAAEIHAYLAVKAGVTL